MANFPRTGKKCTEIKKAREGRAKLLFLFIKYAKFVALSLPPRRGSKTPRCQWFRSQTAFRVARCVYILSSLPGDIFSCFSAFPLSSQTGCFKVKLLVETVGDEGILSMSIAKNPTQQTTVPRFHCFPYADHVTYPGEQLLLNFIFCTCICTSKS